MSSAKQTSDPATHRFRVLNVNDNSAHRALIGQMLSRSGMTIVEAADGKDALSQLSPDLDVVLLDVNLPDVNGFEICRRIKSEVDPFLPVLLISAEAVATVDRISGLEGGADGYLNLPIEPRELVATVNSLGRLRRAERSRALQSDVAVLTAATAVAMASESSLSEVLHQYADAIVNRLAIDAAAVWINDDGTLRLSAVAGMIPPVEEPLKGEFRLPPSLRNGLRQTSNHLCKSKFDLRELVSPRWLDGAGLTAFEGYILPGDHKLTGVAALFATRPIDKELLELLATSADSVALGIERKRSQLALEQSEAISERNAVRIHELETELSRLERLTTLTTPVSSRAFGTEPIRETHPGEFQQAVEGFSRLLKLALEERAYKIEHRIPDGLRELADRLTQLRVGPRDVIEVYSTALTHATGSTTGRKDNAYVEEGRLLVLELMGNLVSNYRAFSLASTSGRGRNRRPEQQEEVKRNG